MRWSWRVLASATLLCTLLCLLAVTATGDTRVGAAAGRGGDGMDILRRAARTGQEIAYQGVKSVSWWDSGALETNRVDVTHEPGVGTLLSPVRGPAPQQGGILTGTHPWAAQDEALLDLLERNFWVSGQGTERVGDWPATVVEARRDDGSTAARFWVHEETGLLLRREIHDVDGQIAQFSVFESVRFDPDPVASAAPLYQGLSGGGELDETALSGLRADGWRLPAALGQGFQLVEARSTGEGSERVVHLSYSDGICLISVFVQRGSLAEGSVAGLRAVEEDGATVHVGGKGQHQRMWEVDGLVYTVLADAPEKVVAASLEALPAPDGTGFWAQVKRGFARLGTWLR